MNVMDWVPRYTENDCETRGAGLYEPSPAWSALILQVPAPMKETIEPEITHTLLELLSIENVTVSPDVELAATL